MTHLFDISICICTYKRPSMLNALLEAVQHLTLANKKVEIIVADNDPSSSAIELLTHWIKKSPFNLTVLHVPTPNIALARNATVNAAQGEWIAFIDDDEIPDEAWLNNLLDAALTYNTPIVFGPVIPVLPPDIPEWLKEGNFYNRRRHLTGTKLGIADARTSNALVKKSLLKENPFNPEYGRTGGSDTYLFQQLLTEGVEPSWCDEAIVYETIPKERASVKWLIKRSFRVGQTRERVLGGIQKSIMIRLKYTFNIVWETIKSAILLPFSKMRSVRRLRAAAWYAGRVSASLGHRYQEYKH